MDQVPVAFDKIMQMRTYTAIVLKGSIADEEKKFAIYVDPGVGKILQMYLTDLEKPRPLTHDLITSMLKGLEVKLKQVVVSDLQDTTYYARIFLEQHRGDIVHIVELDARPSDAITMALMHNAPVFCSKEVLEKTIPVVE